jgi:hypothetical protein
MGSAPDRAPGPDRRRHFRVDGEWTVHVEAFEHTGAVTDFDALALNISMSGMLLETPVTANLWVDKELAVILPGGVGPTRAVVRRFLEYGEDAPQTDAVGDRVREMSVHQSAHWARFVFSQARRSP